VTARCRDRLGWHGSAGEACAACSATSAASAAPEHPKRRTGRSPQSCSYCFTDVRCVSVNSTLREPNHVLERRVTNHQALVNGYLQPHCHSRAVIQCESRGLPQRHGLMEQNMLAISIARFPECRFNNGISAGMIGTENMPRMTALFSRQRTVIASKRPRAALRPLGPRRCCACH